jgi:hypothetical protein
MPDNGYKMKKQGLLSTYIIGGILTILGVFTVSLSFLGWIILLFALIIFLRLTGKLVIYPSQRILKYSANLLFGTKEFSFDDFDGFLVEKTKTNGITSNNSFVMEFNSDGKYKKLMLASNISAKTQRTLTEEISQLMGIQPQNQTQNSTTQMYNQP